MLFLFAHRSGFCWAALSGSSNRISAAAHEERLESGAIHELRP
jgi:hypothetical protein